MKIGSNFKKCFEKRLRKEEELPALFTRSQAKQAPAKKKPFAIKFQSFGKMLYFMARKFRFDILIPCNSI